MVRALRLVEEALLHESVVQSVPAHSSIVVLKFAWAVENLLIQFYGLSNSFYTYIVRVGTI